MFRQLMSRWKRVALIGWALVLMAVVLIIPCSSQTEIVNRTTHGVIRWDETWRGEIHIIGDINVEEGYTLTIDPGTKVLIAANQDSHNLFTYPFNMQQGLCGEEYCGNGVHQGEPFRDEGNHISIIVTGTLHAVGTPEEMITITSDSENPTIYDWNELVMFNGILSYTMMEYYRILEPEDGTVVSHNILRNIGECGICANSTVLIEHNDISYAGHELIDMHNASPVIHDNHLGPSPMARNPGGVLFGGGGIVIDGGSPEIVNNTIDGCEHGINFISPPDIPYSEWIPQLFEDNVFRDNTNDIEDHNGNIYTAPSTSGPGRILDTDEYKLIYDTDGTFLSLENVKEPENAENVVVTVKATINGQEQLITDSLDIVDGKGTKTIRLRSLFDTITVQEVKIEY